MKLSLLLLLLTTGCAVKRPVQRYQERATKACEAKHAPEECKPLSYPACDENGCHQ